jgi:hypothetical protein
MILLINEEMTLRFQGFSLVILAGLFMVLPMTTGAFDRSDNPLYDTTGDLSLMENPRELRFEQAGVYIAPEAASWTGKRSRGPEFSFSAAGEPISLSAIPGVVTGFMRDDNGAVTAVISFADTRKVQWPGLERAEFTRLNAQLLGDVWHVTLQQMQDGIPVYGSRLDAKVTRDGSLVAISARLFPAERVAAGFGLPANIAMKSLTINSSTKLDYSSKVYYPVQVEEEIHLIPAWQLRVTTDQADLRPAGIVDARSGAVLLRYNDVAFEEIYGNVTGLVLPMYWNDEPQAWVQRFQRVDVTGQGFVHTDTNGDYSMTLAPNLYPIQGWLEGLWVDVNYEDGPDATYLGTASTTSPTDWLWDYELARQDEANMYYHVTLVHDYFKTLQPDFTAMDFPLPATVAYGTNYENAFWNGYGIYFGTGAGTFRNFALFCDVIYHEYVHGVTDMIYPPGMLPYTGQPGAMNEAWSDYFACTITDESQMGEGGLYTNGQVMRDLNNNLVYPAHWAGEVHADGRIIGGAFWDLREAVGAAIADSLLHYAKYSLAEQWEDYFLDVLILDDDDADLSNGGPHHPEIYESFGIHGIGPGVEPDLEIALSAIVEDGTNGSSGNGNGFFEPEEILSMSFSVSDLRWLYPPAAEDVTVSVSSDNPDLSFEPTNFLLGSIPAGMMVEAPENLLITVSPEADLAFAQIIFEISANGGAYQVTDSLEIVVGHPTLLLVDDDGGDHYQQFFDASLRISDQIYSDYDVSDSGAISLDLLMEFEVAVWLTGDESSNTLTAEDQNNLAQYLESGRSLFITGQDLVEDIGSTAFFTDYLGVSPVAGQVSGYFSLEGVEGDPVSGGQWVMILGAEAGNNQTSPGAIAALPGAEEIFYYTYDPQFRAGGVRYDSGNFKTVTFSFGAEAISGLAESTPLEDILGSILAWFELTTDVKKDVPEVIVDSFRLGTPFPNPFNPVTTINYQLPKSSMVTLSVYDVSGRQVAELVNGWRDAGAHNVTFDASTLASGLYFYRIEAGGFTDVKKMVLVK